MNNTASILVIEDEISLATVVCEYLQHGGFRATAIYDGGEAIAHVKKHAPDLIILDLMLPNVDGLTIYRELRTFCDIPVIMATAKVDEIDRLVGLELGADDYLCKPYSPRELVVRVKNILRRFKAAKTTADTSSPLQLNAEAMQATLAGQLLPLTPVEFRLLTHFARHPARIFNREQLIQQIYDDHRVVSDRTMDSHIKNLRKKLGEALPEAQSWIESVYGVGYRWTMDG